MPLPSEMFPVIDASDWEIDVDEPAGADEKLWLREPGSDVRWLYKPVTEKNGHAQGEDWAEKIACGLARMLTVPCADVELAVRNGRHGSLSKNLRPPQWQMHPGLVLLSSTITDYRPGTENVKGRPGHSLPNIQAVLKDALPPPGAEVPEWFTAFDTFVGYLILDAWIANRDRHDENWSVLFPLTPDQRPRLCGSYDQAGSMGYNLREAERERLLSEPGGLERWALKGTAYRFEHNPGERPPTLVKHASDALGLVDHRTRAYWLNRLADVSEEDELEVVSSVPGMSDPCRSFALGVLKINRGRLLHDSQ
jgi:hypothetical protein